MWNVASFSTSLKFEPPAFENAARYMNAETNFLCRDDRPMALPSLVKLGPRTPERRSVQVPTPKIAQRKRTKSSITQPFIIRFRSNYAQSLNAWHSKCCKRSRSRGQRSSLQRDITRVKIRKIVNNSAGDCSISLKIRADIHHVTLDVPRTFKVDESKVKVTRWRNVSASNNAIIQARISCRRSNLVTLSQSRAQHVTWCSRSLGQISKAQ